MVIYYIILSMNVSDLSKARVLAALYNAAKQQGAGFLHFETAPMTEKRARELLGSGKTHYDYLNGRMLKIDLGQDEIDTRVYNQVNGFDAAENAIEMLRLMDKYSNVVSCESNFKSYKYILDLSAIKCVTQ